MIEMRKILAAGAVASAAICVESIRERRHFRVTHYDLDTPKMEADAGEVTIVFLSDLHNQIYGANNDMLLRTVADVKPDVILIGGDMLIGKRDRLPKPALTFVRKLPKIAPTYYSNGNHEQRMKENTKKYGNVFERYQKKLREADVRFLENDSAEFTKNGLRIMLTGLELPMETYEKFRQMDVCGEDVARQVGTASEGYFHILMAHNPVYFSGYKEWGADLVLSGHLHGGIVRIPGWRGCITPQAFPFPKYSGEMTTEEEHTIIVSKGLGTHTINLRLFNEPEVVVVHIHGGHRKK